ncbi:unnamed protein product [Rhizophagus irregularis]|nr:unnamed protein product [Rhizophagus irregularis]
MDENRAFLDPTPDINFAELGKRIIEILSLIPARTDATPSALVTEFKKIYDDLPTRAHVFCDTLATNEAKAAYLVSIKVLYLVLLLERNEESVLRIALEYYLS